MFLLFNLQIKTITKNPPMPWNIRCWNKNTYWFPNPPGSNFNRCFILVGRGGFEPPKSKTSDLQSDPFGRSGICPYIDVALFCCGAGDWTRTHNLLITNQLLCQLSYTGMCFGALGRNWTSDRQIFSLLLYQLSYQGVYGDPERARTVDLQRDRLAL